MDERKLSILKAIVQEYIRTAKPVSSSTLQKKYSLKVSPATIRNDMATLEKEGYIIQPHTSAGRIPTEKGYRLTISEYMDREQQIVKREKDALKRQLPTREVTDESLMNLARKLAQLSRETVIVGQTPQVYTAGIANLFRQPELTEHELVEHVGGLLDHLDEVFEGLFSELPDDVAVLVGSESPFGIELGTIVTKYKLDGQEGILCILGPIRMNYRDNIGRLNYSRELLSGR